MYLEIPLTARKRVYFYSAFFQMRSFLDFFQVCGRLPFDDSNHKKLLKLVNHGANFPDKREISADCKDLIKKILVKRDRRLRIPEIRCHVWYRTMLQNMALSATRERRPSTSSREK